MRRECQSKRSRILRKVRTTMLPLLFLLTIMIPGIAARSESGKAALTYYSGSSGKLLLEAPPSQIGYLLPLQGKASVPALVIRIAKQNSRLPDRMLQYYPGRKKSFSFRCILRDGTGNYTVTIFGKDSIDSLRYYGLCSFTVSSRKGIPDNLERETLNGRILSFVKDSMGKTIGRGECWDLVQEALDSNGADWRRPTDYGIQLNPKKDTIEPGDIIQFKSVKITMKKPNGGYIVQTIGNPDHTSIVYTVLGDRHYRLAHQNINGKRHVIVTEVDLSKITSGSYRIYRAVPGILF